MDDDNFDELIWLVTGLKGLCSSDFFFGRGVIESIVFTRMRN